MVSTTYNFRTKKLLFWEFWDWTMPQNLKQMIIKHIQKSWT